MSSRIAQVTLDVIDPQRMAEFWCAALGYSAFADEGTSIHLAIPGDPDTPTVWLQPVDAPTPGKNRCHLDLDTPDREAEVARLLALGARHADVGQGTDEGFTVLQDPEGNEFCVLHAQHRTFGTPRRD